MTDVPIHKLNELLDEYRDMALNPVCNRMWLALAQLVGAYEEEEDPDGFYPGENRADG